MSRKWIAVLMLWSVLSFAGQRKRDTHLDWVGTWASSQQAADAGNVPPAPGLAGNTLRQVVHVSAGGKQLRARFSNAFGATPMVVSAARIAKSAGGSAIVAGSDRALLFQGQLAVTIPPGALMVSDPVDFDLAALSDVTITIRLSAVPETITTHPGSRTTSYLMAGDAVSVTELPAAVPVDHWYVLSGIDVVVNRLPAAVVILGDSITDGRGTTTNKNGRWPDFLARRLQANKRTAHIVILNSGIGGNRLLNDGLGPNALARLDRDVLAQPGVRWLVVFEGTNDIGTRDRPLKPHEHAIDAQKVIAAYQQIIARAHSRNIRVYGATILPFGGHEYFTPAHEADRQTINKWIRSSGEFDAVIDFDAAARDPENPTRLSSAVDCGDHLHATDAGYKILADSVDLKLFME